MAGQFIYLYDLISPQLHPFILQQITPLGVKTLFLELKGVIAIQDNGKTRSILKLYLLPNNYRNYSNRMVEN